MHQPTFSIYPSSLEELVGGTGGVGRAVGGGAAGRWQCAVHRRLAAPIRVPGVEAARPGQLRLQTLHQVVHRPGQHRVVAHGHVDVDDANSVADS